MHSSFNYRVDNEYVDVADIKNFPKSIPRTENENLKDIKGIRIRLNFLIVFISIIILINIFLVGYIAKSQIFQLNNKNGIFYY